MLCKTWLRSPAGSSGCNDFSASVMPVNPQQFAAIPSCNFRTGSTFSPVFPMRKITGGRKGGERQAFGDNVTSFATRSFGLSNDVQKCLGSWVPIEYPHLKSSEIQHKNRFRLRDSRDSDPDQFTPETGVSLRCRRCMMSQPWRNPGNTTQSPSHPVTVSHPVTTCHNMSQHVSNMSEFTGRLQQLAQASERLKFLVERRKDLILGHYVKHCQIMSYLICHINSYIYFGCCLFGFAILHWMKHVYAGRTDEKIREMHLESYSIQCLNIVNMSISANWWLMLPFTGEVLTHSHASPLVRGKATSFSRASLGNSHATCSASSAKQFSLHAGWEEKSRLQ